MKILYNDSKNTIALSEVKDIFFQKNADGTDRVFFYVKNILRGYTVTSGSIDPEYLLSNPNAYLDLRKTKTCIEIYYKVFEKGEKLNDNNDYTIDALLAHNS